MEALTRLVADSLARHGLDRPVDPRRLQWSSWFRCDSPRSLLFVPSKPGIFAVAEEMMEIGNFHGGADELVSPCHAHVGTAVGSPVERSSQDKTQDSARRMLAVLQFSEDDDMAYVLDRMFTYANPMRSRLHSGSCFVRFVVVEDQHQRRSICAALNQWMRNSAEKATGLPADFSSSLEFTSVGRTLFAANAASAENSVGPTLLSASAETEIEAQVLRPQPVALSAAHPNSGAGKNLHCPPPFPSGF